MYLSGTVTFELDVIVMCNVHQILPYFGVYRDLFSTAINIRNFGCLLCDDAAVAPRRRRGEATEDVDAGGRRARRRCQSSEGGYLLQSSDGCWAYRRQWAAEDRSHGVFSRFTVLTGVYRKYFPWSSSTTLGTRYRTDMIQFGVFGIFARLRTDVRARRCDTQQHTQRTHSLQLD